MTSTLARPAATGPAPRLRTSRWALAAVGAAVLTLLVALALGGGAAGFVLPGLPDPGPVTRWGLPLAKLMLDGAGTVTVGLLLLGVLIPARKDELHPDALRAIRLASLWAGVWALAAATAHVLTLSDLIGLPLAEALSGNSLTTFTLSVEQGQAYAIVVLLAVAIVPAARWTLRPGGALALLVLGVSTLVPPALVGHSSSGDYHHSAAFSLIVHVVAVSLWVGGLVALTWYAGVSRGRSSQLPRAARAFSPLALGAVVAVGASGVLNAAVRLYGLSDLVTTTYGRLLLVKVALLVVLVWAGARHRARTLRDLDAGRPRAFSRLAAGEVVVMAATMGLAVALSRTEPPVPESLENASRVREVLGFAPPGAPTPSSYITEVYPEAMFGLLAVGMTVLYLAGVLRLRRRGDRWPVGRTIAWLLGTGVMVFITMSGVMTYGMLMLSVHMVQHMTLAMLVPVLLVLGAPITLALRAIPAAGRGQVGPRERILSVLHSPVVRVLTHPIVAFGIFVTAAPMIYFSGLFEYAMFNHTGHMLMGLHFLLGGYLFFEVVIGTDPLPSRPAYPIRIIMVLASAGFHAFFAVGIMESARLVAGDYYALLGSEIAWLPDTLADQRDAGSITWGLGEIPALIVLIALVVQWARSDDRESRRRDRRATDPELDQYNAYLAALAARDAEQQPPPRPRQPGPS
jgi:cytochrome c oxidase assembly factor CtaG/putative copper export protein